MNNRKPEYKVLDLIINRWSPRAMSGEQITDEELMALFEAAKWAASSYNNQPWRFVYVKKESTRWPEIFNLLASSNQIWAKNAAALIVAISYKFFEFNKKPSRTHSLDTGASTANLALQGYSMGLVVHGIEGFDYEKTKDLLNIPDDYQVEAMYAIGKPAPLSVLPENLQEREVKSDRKKIKEFAFKDSFYKK